MMVHYSKELLELSDKLKLWFDMENRDSEGCLMLKPDTPEELKALYPRYKKLRDKEVKLNWGR